MAKPFRYDPECSKILNSNLDEQKENRVEFDDALVSQHDIVRDEEGPLMKDEMMNEMEKDADRDEEQMDC